MMSINDVDLALNQFMNQFKPHLITSVTTESSLTVKDTKSGDVWFLNFQPQNSVRNRK